MLGAILNGTEIQNSSTDYVTSYQIPTAANNYTWYRKYKSGWVEQGGEFTLTISAGNSNININLPVEMANGRYTALVNGGFISNVAFLKWNIVSRNTSAFNVAGDTSDTTSSGTTNTCCWQVSGMAA